MSAEPIKKGKLYYCPFDCGDKRYPKPKWKTEKGAINHVSKCWMRPEKVKEREELEKKEIQESRERDEQALSSAKYNVGDKVHHIQTIVVKPMYEQRFNRMVKVRYEEEKNYIARTSEIESVQPDGLGAVVYNGYVYERDIRANLDDAAEEAKEMKSAHLDHLRESSLLR